MERLLDVLQYPEAVALVATAIGWLVVAIARWRRGNLTESDADKLHDHTVAQATAAMVYAIPMIAAALASSTEPDWVRIVLGAVMAAIGPSGVAEAVKAQKRRTKLKQEGS
jgi:uncharacterized BrkB/YihY/UPF0761 family membrane protein